MANSFRAVDLRETIEEAIRSRLAPGIVLYRCNRFFHPIRLTYRLYVEVGQQEELRANFLGAYEPTAPDPVMKFEREYDTDPLDAVEFLAAQINLALG
jgi:hypothetical protein